MKWLKGEKIYDFEIEIVPRGYSDPVLGLYTCKVKQVNRYISDLLVIRSYFADFLGILFTLVHFRRQ